MLHQEISSHKEDKVHNRKRLSVFDANWKGEFSEPVGVAELGHPERRLKQRPPTKSTEARRTFRSLAHLSFGDVV
jgi:hypothetical protein